MFGYNLLLGLTPSDIKEFLQPIIDEEGSLEGNFDKRPKLTVSDGVSLINFVLHNDNINYFTVRFFLMKLIQLLVLDF